MPTPQGQGTSTEPYIINDYYTLVSYATNDVYIKIGQDIDISNEYPDGDMPTLSMARCHIDGDGHTISNWYKTTSGNAIGTFIDNDYESEIKNLNFNNIYMAENATAFFEFVDDGSLRPFFINCTFRGILYKPFTVDDSKRFIFKNCGLYLDTKNIKPFGNKCAVFENTRFQATGTYNSSDYLYVYDLENTYMTKNSYLELNLPNLTNGYIIGYDNQSFINSIIDITTNAETHIGYGSDAVSIVNKVNGPNIIVDGTNCKGVDTEAHWVDPTWLNTNLGFNAG